MTGGQIQRAGDCTTPAGKPPFDMSLSTPKIALGANRINLHEKDDYPVLYMRTSELVQRLQTARQTLQLPQALAKLDRYDLLIL